VEIRKKMNLVTGDPAVDFFEQNPELKTIEVFNELIANVGEENASKILWSIYLIEDPNSRIFRMPRGEKISEIKSTYYPEFDLKKYSRIVDKYKSLILSKEERMYSIHVEKMDELTSHLDELKLDNDDDFTKYVKIMEKLPKVWDSLERVKKKMISKQSSNSIRGSGQRSAREKRAKI